jgi:ABC-type multidrug transport system ATPase subunit
VEQNDIHMPLITVKESIEFSSALRLPKGTSAARRQQFMQQVMDLLELNEIGDKLVGTIGDAGLSIEEAKRLTIGVELVGIYNFPTYLNQNG